MNWIFELSTRQNELTTSFLREKEVEYKQMKTDYELSESLRKLNLDRAKELEEENARLKAQIFKFEAGKQLDNI